MYGKEMLKHNLKPLVKIHDNGLDREIVFDKIN